MSSPSQTLFSALNLWSWEGNSETWDRARETGKLFTSTDRSDSIAELRDSFTMNIGDTVNIAPAVFSASEWVYVIIKIFTPNFSPTDMPVPVVLAGVTVHTSGVDNGSNSIAGITKVYGTQYLPGFLVLQTTGLSAITLVGLTANAAVEVFTATIVQPTDSRLL